jgi:hypothetical protein
VNQEPVALKMAGLPTEKKKVEGKKDWGEGGRKFYGLTSQKNIILILTTLTTVILTDLININGQHLFNVS